MVLIDTFGYDELRAEAAWKEGISLQHLDKTATWQDKLLVDSAVIQMNVRFIDILFFFFKSPFAWGALFSLYGTR